MLKNYLKIALRIIKRQKGYTLINVVGLACGLASFILILLYVRYELSFDLYHKNADLIYRVTSEDKGRIYMNSFQMAQAHPGVALYAKSDFPEVKSIARFNRLNNVRISYKENHFLEDNFFYAEPEIFDIFFFPLLKGDPKMVLQDPFSIFLSEEMANKYFGNDDPIGKIIRYEDEYDFKVTGVFKNLPKNSHFTMDFVIPFKTSEELFGRDLNAYDGGMCYTYVLLQDPYNLTELEDKLSALPDKYFYDNPDMKERRQLKYHLQSLSKIHLHSHLNFELTENSDIRNIYISLLIGILILVIACINYLNLVTARSAQRGREVGIRKVVGAQRLQLIKQFFGESILLTAIAFGLSIILVLDVLPEFSAFMERDLSFNITQDFTLFIWIFAVVIIVGLFAGCYPALIISAYKPVFVFRGKFKGGSKGSTLRNILVLSQFTISIVLIVCTLVIRNQVNYMNNKDSGYNRDQIVVVQVRDESIHKNMEALKTELLKHPNVTSASISSHVPNNMDWQLRVHWPEMPEDISIIMNFATVDYEFTDLYGIELIEGRGFSQDHPSDENGAFLFNEAAVKSLNWESPVNKEFDDWFISREGFKTGRVVGVMKDFHMLSLHNKIEPLYLYLPPKSTNYENRRMFFNRYLSVKLNSENMSETLVYVENQIANFSPQYPFEYYFFDEMYGKAYDEEQRMRSMFITFSIIAIGISCLGLFGLASYSASARTKEIGVRKVLGASVSNLIFYLSKEFTKWVLLANLIGWPIAYFVMNNWLQNFAYQIEIGWMVFLGSGALVLLIALLTVCTQAIKVSLTNPVEALRYE